MFVLKKPHSQTLFESMYNYQEVPSFFTHQDQQHEEPNDMISFDNVGVTHFSLCVLGKLN